MESQGNHGNRTTTTKIFFKEVFYKNWDKHQNIGCNGEMFSGTGILIEIRGMKTVYLILHSTFISKYIPCLFKVKKQINNVLSDFTLFCA